MPSRRIAILDPAATVVDIDSVVGLMTETFGERGDEKALVETWLTETHRCVRVAVNLDNDVVGLAVLTVPERFDAVAYGEPFGTDVAARVGAGPVALFNQLLVAPGARQQGVATALASAVGDWVVRRGVAAVLGISWHHGGDHHSGHLFLRAGFTALGQCRGFYQRFHDATGQQCTVCQPAPCDCTASLFGLSLP